MSTNQRPSLHRPSLDVGFLERKPRVGTMLTLMVLVLVGVVGGSVVGLVLTRTLEWLLASFMAGG